MTGPIPPVVFVEPGAAQFVCTCTCGAVYWSATKAGADMLADACERRHDHDEQRPGRAATQLGKETN